MTEAPIDSDDLVKRVMRPSDGACVVFEGVVRNHDEGKKVESIFYDAYRPMAEKEITKILDDITTRFPEVRIEVQHRLGLLRVGEASIVIACSAPHRGEAFDACRTVIDRFKQTVPIWKKERGPGGEEWVGWQK
ncbi:MAG TPA: molybdenum cofactor biosynthesis protein MoaE [Thermoanaerobaculia bacterium]|nr:molybdenum cofactor biosynthesis protein MoaE [Thermoanaerobaculia bacterium]